MELKLIDNINSVMLNKIQTLVSVHEDKLNNPKDGNVEMDLETCLLPHGWINSGNIYPTLAAFGEFISELKMPAGASSKDINDMQIGRPFKPAMFEVILKNFTAMFLISS
ncbi:hypothetical protein R6Q59_007114 [Mikania micrantha]